MQYSWHFQYSSTLINLGRDNMFSLVSLFLFFFFTCRLFGFAACFFMCRRHKGLAATAASERDISGSPA